MREFAASCRLHTPGTTSISPWRPSSGSGLGWGHPSLQVLSRFRGLKRRGIAFSGRIPYFGGRFFTPRSRPMRVVTVIALLLVGGAATLDAQHHFQFEVGGFAAYTRFDRALLLENQIGGGGRIGFWITDWLGIEGDGLYQRPRSKAGGANFPVWFASGSVVLNFGSEKSFYILGGYSAMDFNSNATGGFRDSGVHGAIGDRIYISDRAALRLEARAYYAPTTQLPGGTWGGQVVGSAGLSFFLGPSHRESAYPEVPEVPKEKRDSIVAAGGKVPEARPRGGPSYEQRSSDWQHKWYWGGQAGVLVFRTN